MTSGRTTTTPGARRDWRPEAAETLRTFLEHLSDEAAAGLRSERLYWEAMPAS